MNTLTIGAWNVHGWRDYTKARWDEIAATHRENRWESPMTEVTDWTQTGGGGLSL